MGRGVAVGWAVGLGVAVGFAVGAAVGLCVGTVVGVGIISGVAVGCAVGAGVAVGSGTSVAVAVGTGAGVAVASGGQVVALGVVQSVCCRYGHPLKPNCDWGAFAASALLERKRQHSRVHSVVNECLVMRHLQILSVCVKCAT